MNVLRPRLFIGSSVEGLAVAEALQNSLQHAIDVTVWSQGVFGVSRSTLSELIEATKCTDFALLVLSADDLVTKRDDTASAPRDNVLFELGLFMGALGADRTFIVRPRGLQLAIPSDLLGISMADFPERADGNLRAALGPACNEIKQAIQRAMATTPMFIKHNQTDLAAISRKYSPSVHRGRTKIAVVDDEPFPPAELLRASGFQICELGDVSEVENLSEYPIVVCDVKGVGKAFGSKHEGAYLLKLIRERYPDMYLIAFTGYAYAPSLFRFLDLADDRFSKDIEEDVWATKLDEVIGLLTNPVETWKRLRTELLDRDINLNAVLLLEQCFVQAIRSQALLPAQFSLPALSPEDGARLVSRVNHQVRRLIELGPEAGHAAGL